MDKRWIGGIVMLVGGVLDEVILQSQSVSFVKQLMPNWGGKVFNQAVAIPVMAVGIVTLWALWKRNPESEPTSKPTRIRQQSTSSVENSGNVTQTAGDLHLHLSPYPSPQPAPEPTQIVRPTPTPKNEPNLQFSKWKEEIIAFDTREGKWQPAEHSYHSYKAILLKVDNSPKRDAVVIPCARLSAHLRFIPDNAEDDLTISPGCWYDHPFGAIEMAVPSHEWLIIGARKVDPNRTLASLPTIALGNRRLVSGYSMKDFFDMQIPERGVVEVQLMEGGSVLTEQRYDYSLGEKYSLTRQDTATSSSPVGEPRPRLEIREIRSAGLLLSSDKHNRWIEHSSGYQAQIIVFKNKQGDIGKEAPIAEDVVARLIYTPSNEKSLEINAGCWIDEELQYVDIKPGEVAKLAVAMRLQKSGRFVALRNPRESLPAYISARAHMRSHVVPIETLEIPAVPCKVEITLISKNVTLYHGTFELREGTEGAMQLDPKF